MLIKFSSDHKWSMNFDFVVAAEKLGLRTSLLVSVHQRSSKHLRAFLGELDRVIGIESYSCTVKKSF